MASSDKTIIAFDLYGTLLSTESIAKALSTHFGDEKAGNIAALWRRYQLEYTWRCNSMKRYIPFSTLTRRSLLHALAENSLTLPAAPIEDLLQQYNALSTFPDVPPALKDLSNDPSIHAVVFSNGTDDMVTSSINNSQDLRPHNGVFEALITVEDVERFKPDPEVYRHLARRVGKQTDSQSMESMWLVSGNPFDVVGAKAVGMRAAWVDRAGNGWVDGLMSEDEARPDLIVTGLGEVVEGVRRFQS